MEKEKPQTTLGQDAPKAALGRDELGAWLEEIRALETKLIQLKHELVESAAMPLDPAERGAATFLMLRTAGRQFAAPIAYIDEVVQVVAVSPLPEKRPNVVGLLNYHGNLIAVLDLAEIVGMSATQINADCVLVICALPPVHFALVVEEASDVITVRPEDIHVAEEVLPGVLKAAGVLRAGAQPAIIIDIWSIGLAAQMTYAQHKTSTRVVDEGSK